MSPVPRLLGGRYEVGELIGRGGMAEVHAGHDTRLGRSVAIKMLRSDLARDQSFLARFRREAQSAAGLNHPSIVAVYDSGEDRVAETSGAVVGVPFIVMEYVHGRTLQEALAGGTPFAPAEAARVTEGILTALAYSHRMGIVHRDIKPANVMLTHRGDVKVMDFGIARAIADSAATMTQTQAVIGTAQYLSPEQAQGTTVDARSDLYSTGCLLYELLTGRAPFVGDSPVAIAYQHVGEPPQPPSLHNPEVGSDLDAVVLHALVKNRDARYQDADQFRADLQAARTGRPISTAARGTARGTAASSAGPVGPAADATMRLGRGVPTEAVALGVATAERGGNTASLPAIGHDPDEDPRRRHGATYTLLTLAVIAALVGVAFAGRALFAGDQAAPTYAIPRVIGQSSTTAATKLRQAGFNPVVSNQPSERPKGEVVDQNPPGGQRYPADTSVTITVSTGPAQVQVPDVTNFPEAAAKTALAGVGLTVSEVRTVDDKPLTDKGLVVGTVPAAGELAADGSTVVLQVSSGKVTVPDVVGSDLADAQNALTRAGLRSTTQFQPSSHKENSVLTQTSAGDKVPTGTIIKLVVAEPQPPSPTSSPTPTTEPPTSPPPTTEPPTSTPPTSPTSSSPPTGPPPTPGRQ